ncbi:MAG: acyl-ACP--UDP-N-acetylglucosamine O-acyltransferase [Phycisphaerales bacterium]
MGNVHPTAIVHESARIDDTAVIGPYCVVGPDVSIGGGTVLFNHVTVRMSTTIGRDNRIHPFAVIGDDPQDRKFRGERTTLAIGDGNVIREHVTIHRGTANGGGSTRVGSRNLMMVMAHVAHDCEIGDHVLLANQVMLAGHVRVEDGATVSASAGVHHYATVGTCSFIGALARIPKDVPPYMIVEGNPAEVRGWNRLAMQRRGYAETDVDAIKEAYKRLFRDNGSPMIERLAAVRLEFPHSRPVQRLCDSLQASAEGVHGRSRETTRPDDKRSLRLEPVEDTGFADTGDE